MGGLVGDCGSEDNGLGKAEASQAVHRSHPPSAALASPPCGRATRNKVPPSRTGARPASLPLLDPPRGTHVPHLTHLGELLFLFFRRHDVPHDHRVRRALHPRARPGHARPILLEGMRTGGRGDSMSPALDAIAEEVERIGEGQRFITRIMSEGAGRTTTGDARRAASRRIEGGMRGCAGARVRTSTAMVFAFATCICGDVAAQTTAPHASFELMPGARVRATAPSTGTVVGNVLSASNDSVRIELAGGSSITLPTSRLTRLELSGGVQRHGWKGAGIGLLSGALVGGTIGLATYRKPSCEPDPVSLIFCGLITPVSREVTVMADVRNGGGAAGALVGALIGHAGRETWVRVPTFGAGTRVGLMGRSAIGVRIAL